MKRRRRARGTVFMIAALAVGGLLFFAGLTLRGTMLSGNAEFAETPAISIPLLLMQDMSPIYEALEEVPGQADVEAVPALAESAPEPADVLTAEPEITELPVWTVADTPEPLEEISSALTEAPTALPSGTPTVQPTDTPTEAPTEEPIAWAPDESCFDHTLFIGDSRTDGMRMWARLGEAEYFCGTSYTVFNILKKEASDKNFGSMKLKQLLKKREYNQIYILLGFNEAGYAYDALMKQFQKVILTVHELQPQARIILYGIMQPSRKVSTASSDFSLQKIGQINRGLEELSQASDILFYVPCTTAFYDEDGYMRSDVTTDGEHLKPDSVRQWAQEIMKDAIAP